MADFVRDPEGAFAAKEIFRRGKEVSAGEDAREPAGRSGFPRSLIFRGFRRKRNVN